MKALQTESDAALIKTNSPTPLWKMILNKLRFAGLRTQLWRQMQVTGCVTSSPLSLKKHWRRFAVLSATNHGSNGELQGGLSALQSIKLSSSCPATKSWCSWLGLRMQDDDKSFLLSAHFVFFLCLPWQRWFSRSEPTGEPTRGLGQPTIPCTEPKTFWSVAVRCHGQARFSRKHTQMASMCEFNLCHINLRFMLKQALTLDALLCECTSHSAHFWPFNTAFTLTLCVWFLPTFPDGSSFHFLMTAGISTWVKIHSWVQASDSERKIGGWWALSRKGKVRSLTSRLQKSRSKPRKEWQKESQEPPRDDSCFGTTFGTVSPCVTFSGSVGLQ